MHKNALLEEREANGKIFVLRECRQILSPALEKSHLNSLTRY